MVLLLLYDLLKEIIILEKYCKKNKQEEKKKRITSKIKLYLLYSLVELFISIQ